MSNYIYNLHCHIVDTIQKINQAEWENLFAEDIIEGYNYHKTLEESRLKEFNQRYLLLQQGKKIVAIIPFFTADFSFTTIIQGPLQKAILFLQKRIGRFLKIKILFLGTPTAEKFYSGFSRTLPLEEILKKALEKIYLICKEEKIGTILFYNLAEEDREIMKRLEKLGFLKIENFPNTLITIKASSLEEYTKTLSRNSRKDLRRKMKKAQELKDLVIEVRDEVGSLKEDIHRLYMNNFINSAVHFEMLTPEFFENICRNMAGVAKFFLFWQNDKLIAFNLCLVKKERCIDKFIGFHRQLAHKYHLYHLSFCHNIDWCIKNNICSYQMGITDYYPKIRLGAKLIPLYNYLRITNPIFNCSAKFIAPLTSPVRYDPTLKNLKRKNQPTATPID